MIASDLQALREGLESRFSYLDRVPYDPDALLAARPRGQETDAMAIARALAPLADGHTRVRDFRAHLPPERLPCRTRAVGQTVVALAPDRPALLDPARPRLVAIDGVPVAEAREAVAAYFADGSPAWCTRYTAALGYLGLLRITCELPAASTVALTLAGDDETTVTLPVAAPADRPIWPEAASGMRDGIAYLRLPSMSGQAAAEEARGALDALDTSRGLIVDVRGNGGGERFALRAVLSRVLGGGRPPARVTNVAAYRRRPDEARRKGGGWLVDRFLHLDDAPHWSDAARRAIAELDFAPSWIPDPERFTDWHYMVVEARGPAIEAPVVLLIDERCYSATDIFVGAFAGLPGVTLVGRPTAGGSGRSLPLTLPSGLEVRLSSMASYRADGLLFEGAGNAPDVLVPASVDDWLDGRDHAYQAALELLR